MILYVRCEVHSHYFLHTCVISLFTEIKFQNFEHHLRINSPENLNYYSQKFSNLFLSLTFEVKVAIHE